MVLLAAGDRGGARRRWYQSPPAGRQPPERLAGRGDSRPSASRWSWLGDDDVQVFDASRRRRGRGPAAQLGPGQAAWWRSRCARTCPTAPTRCATRSSAPTPTSSAGVFVFGDRRRGAEGPPTWAAARRARRRPARGAPARASSRLVGLGGLIGLLAFRWLVWAPALRDALARASQGERDAVRPGAATPSGWASASWPSARCSPRATCWWCRARACWGRACRRARRRDRHQPGAGRHPLRRRSSSCAGALLFALFALGAVHVHPRVRQRRPPKPPSATGSRAGGPRCSWRRCCSSVLGGIARPGARERPTSPRRCRSAPSSSTSSRWRSGSPGSR